MSSACRSNVWFKHYLKKVVQSTILFVNQRKVGPDIALAAHAFDVLSGYVHSTFSSGSVRQLS